MGHGVQFAPLSPSLGVQVDLDASKEFTPAEQEEVGRLFDEHHLLLFRGRELSLDDQRRTVGYLAEAKDHGLIDTAPAQNYAADGELLFHSDLAYESSPHYGISLYGLDVSPKSASTSFANLRRAYLQLPDELRARLQGKQALHLWEFNHSHQRIREEDATDEGTGAVHPVFFVNPRTGEPVLYVSILATARILTLDVEESDALLAQAFSYLYAPENVYPHRWRLHDLVVWNNLALHHAREPRTDDGPRVLRKMNFGDVVLPRMRKVATARPGGVSDLAMRGRAG